VNGPKVLFFDIESTALNATFGTILCIGYKFLGDDEVFVPTILDGKKRGNMLDDKKLVERFAKVYNHSDYSVGHYSSRFDLPMIRTKLLKWGLPPLQPKPHIDTWWIARRELKLHSNRLAVLQDFLGCPTSKTPLKPDDWIQAAHGSKPALDYIVDHCRADVLVLEEVFLKLRPLAKEEPNRALFTLEKESCPSCGGTHLNKRGFHISKTRRYQVFQCQDCGKWTRDTHADKEARCDLR
jgi:uncharacterized protein YprB with RNaseH-like and TPR domain